MCCAKLRVGKAVGVIECDCGDPLVSTLLHNCVRIFYGMVLIQQLVSTKLGTFAEISEYLMKKITSNEAKVIYFVTDQYNKDSLKSIERQRRKAAGTIRMQLTRRDQKRPKHFNKFLSDGANKVAMVKFLLKDWSDPERFRHVISDRIILVTVESNCYRLEVSENKVTSRQEYALGSDQEEADTKILLCCQHAVQHFSNHAENVCVATVDTDVVVLAIYYESRIKCNLFVEIGSKGKKGIILVSKMAVNVGQDMADALPALHAISGCDLTSAFYGVGKKKVYNILQNVGAYMEALKELGNQHIFNKNFFPVIQKMVAEFYGIRSCTGINDARYQRFRAKEKLRSPNNCHQQKMSCSYTASMQLMLPIFGNQRCLRTLMQQIRLGMGGAKLEQKHWRLNG